jgi:hypothetical protein
LGTITPGHGCSILTLWQGVSDKFIVQIRAILEKKQGVRKKGRELTARGKKSYDNKLAGFDFCQERHLYC